PAALARGLSAAAGAGGGGPWPQRLDARVRPALSPPAHRVARALGEPLDFSGQRGARGADRDSARAALRAVRPSRRPGPERIGRAARRAAAAGRGPGISLPLRRERIRLA